MGTTILLIDDSAILRRIATNMLGAHPLRYEVVTATRATEGFARACGLRPNLILVDAQLAGTAKAELCQRFLDEPRTAGVPVLLLLGQGVLPPSLGDLPDNVTDTLSKPFTPELLLASVKSILDAMKEGTGFASIRCRVRGDRKTPLASLVDRQSVTDAAACNPAGGRHRTTTIGTIAIDSKAVVGGKFDAVEVQRAKRGFSGIGTLRAAFQGIAAERSSGVLALVLPDRAQMEIYFDTGKIVVVTTRDAEVYSKDAFEVLPAKVSPATLEAAVEEQRHTGVPFFLTLGARGLLSKAAAVDLVHRFGQRCVARSWEQRKSAIRCEFTRLDALPGFALRLEPRKESLDEWLLAALRCLQPEDIAATANHEGYVGTPAFLRNGQAMLNFLELTTKEKELTKRINGRDDLPHIAKSMGVSTESAYVVLYRFRALEIMDYRPAPAAYVVTPRTSFRRVLPLRH